MTGTGIAERVSAHREAGPAVRRLVVTEFRNHEHLGLDLDRSPVVLTGPNGAGKTNVLEALSFLAPGRGLRRARLVEIDRMPARAGVGWAVSARVETAAGPVSIGTGRDPQENSERRLVRVDGRPARSQGALGDILAVSWLVPQMDRLFLDTAGDRRRFLDRLVQCFDPVHAARVNRFRHTARERGRLLRQGQGDSAWFAALEDRMATAGVAVVAARHELVQRLRPLASEGTGPFPGAGLMVACQVQDWLEAEPALAVEDRLRDALQAERRYPAGQPVPGPHRGDLEVRHLCRNMPARQCSTGEQKALLIAIVLAHARLHALRCGAPPLMLLDDVASHLDRARRSALFGILAGFDSQVWLTGTDAALFSDLRDQAQFHELEA
ncbi:MAG: DNA replication/repair protein RecF [Alphaproteobacteria bacterium]|nr:DNA replication/repair protein RecF [Alphaproteobacteria bacterium]